MIPRSSRSGIAVCAESDDSWSESTPSTAATAGCELSDEVCGVSFSGGGGPLSSLAWGKCLGEGWGTEKDVVWGVDDEVERSGG